MYLRQRTKRILFVLILLGAVAAGLTFSGIGARAVEAARVLAEVMAVGQYPSGTPLPREKVSYIIDGTPYVADLYRPATSAKAAVVFAPGADQSGGDDPMFVGFAEALARAGFLVLAPENPQTRNLMVGPEDAVRLAAAVAFLSQDAQVSQVGVIAVSYAVGPAVLAALRPEIKDKVRFILGIGGYYDLTALLTYFTTGNFREDAGDPWRWQETNTYGKWMFVHANASRLENLSDRTTLMAVALRKMKNRDAEVQDLMDLLGPEGWSVINLIENGDPDRVGELRGKLPATIQNALDGLDLARHDLTALSAKLILVHGRMDPIIPYTESLSLAQAAALTPSRVFLVDNLAHAKLSPAGLLDGAVLWAAVYALLSERDALRVGG